jgi:pyridoxamine 5'-phosphate oxidase-like protein
MATWSTFEAAAPELATAGQRLLYQFGPGLGYLATVRPDGGPRLHPICPIVTEGELWAFILRRSPKCRDLERDGRYALHTFPSAEKDDEFALTGRVERVDDDAARARAIEATTAQVGEEEEALYRFDIHNALLAVYEARGVFPPAYAKWSDPDA